MSRRWRYILSVGFVLAVVLNGAVLFAVTRPDWSPLGPYPTQTVQLPRSPVPSLATSDDRVSAVYPVLTVRAGQMGRRARLRREMHGRNGAGDR